ncbi:MAG: M20/M25/M40 family metallo-hydrolase [Acidobacteria bacterium]|nr:M20/M25/M40 family metallo-hydrolase [Acidobacteriota bacterium]
MKQRLIQYFTQNRERIAADIVRLMSAFVAERTINVISERLADYPFLKCRGEEYRVAELVKQEFRRFGIRFTEYARRPERPNVVGTVGRDEAGTRLLLAAHMDIVPAGDGWTTDPYHVTIRDGIAYGRGVLDNKGPLAAIIVAGGILTELFGDRPMAGQLLIAALADEEVTDPDGIDYGIEYLLTERLIRPSHAIIPDIGGDMRQIDVAEKGQAVIRITAQGRQAHGSTPEQGINAIYRMASLVRELERLVLDYTPHAVLGIPTLNLGEIHGGAAPNIVPGECTIHLDIRTVPGLTRQSLEHQLQKCLVQVDGSFRMETISWSEPHQLDPDNEVVRAIQNNSLNLLGFRPEPFGMGGGTFAKTLNLAGIAAVGWGPGSENAFHVTDEWMEIRQLVDFALLICLISWDLLT